MVSSQVLRSFRIGFFIVVGALGAAPALSAFTNVGRARIVADTTVRTDYDSNIFVSSSQVDDFYGTIGGDVRYVRDVGLITADVGAGFNAYGYADHSELNSVDPYFQGQAAYAPSEKTDARATFAVRRSTIGNEQVNDRTKSNDYVFDARLQHLTTEKLGLRATAGYSISNYLTTGYSDVYNYSLGAHAVHVYSPKLKLLAGVTELEWWTKSGPAGRKRPSTRDWRYSVGAEGEFGPKLTGDVSAGLTHRGFDTVGFSDGDSLYAAGRVMWMAAEKTTWTLAASQDLSLTAADQSVKLAMLSLSLNHRLSEKLALDASVGADRSTYVGSLGVGNRRDHGYTVRGRLNYVLNDSASIDVSAGYRNNDSTIGVADYDRLNLGAGVSFRF